MGTPLRLRRPLPHQTPPPRRPLRHPARDPHQLPPHRGPAAADPGTIRAVDHPDETTLIVGTLSFAGVGWHNNGDALLANTAAAMARSRHETGREELAHELGTSRQLVQAA